MNGSLLTPRAHSRTPFMTFGSVGVSPSEIEGDVEMGDEVAGAEEAGVDPALGGEEIDVNVDMPAEVPPV